MSLLAAGVAMDRAIRKTCSIKQQMEAVWQFYPLVI